MLVCFFFLCAPKRAGHCCAPPLAVDVIIVGEHRISVPCGAAFLLLSALDICCHSRTCGCLACTLRGPYVCFVPRDVVSVDGLAQCAHTLPPRRLPCAIAGDGRAYAHRQVVHQKVLYLPVLVEPRPMP